MKYDNYTKEQLLERIEELEILNSELLNTMEQNTKLEYAWTSNLGQWFFNVKTNSVTFNPLKITTLGYDLNEIPETVTYQFFTDKLHPEDYSKTMKAMLDHLQGKVNVYEVEYRIQTKDGNYKWYYDRGKITKYDEKGNPVFLAGIVFDITQKKELEIELAEKNQILAELASVDGLTKVANRRFIINRLEQYLRSSNKSNLSIVLIDIDNFKTINDTKGHVVGDNVLITVSELISKTIRHEDLVGRYGGEEFLVIFPDTTLENAVKISERIRTTIEKHLFTEGLRVTISGGVQKYEGEELEEFINAADSKLYQAKKQGKNRIEY